MIASYSANPNDVPFDDQLGSGHLLVTRVHEGHIVRVCQHIDTGSESGAAVLPYRGT